MRPNLRNVLDDMKINLIVTGSVEELIERECKT